jgi:hypothetical protein
LILAVFNDTLSATWVKYNYYEFRMGMDVEGNGFGPFDTSIPTFGGID